MRKGPKIAIGAAVGVIAIGGIASVAGGGGGGNSKAPVSPAPVKPAKPAKHKTSERDDLISFKVDDRSVSGFSDVWIKYAITNHSSKKSNYEIQWEALNSHGVRVANSTEYVTDVLPGQTIRDSTPTTIPNGSDTLHITSFDRTQAW